MLFSGYIKAVLGTMARQLVIATDETMGLSLAILLIFDTTLLIFMFFHSEWKPLLFFLITDRTSRCKIIGSVVIQYFEALLKIIGVGIIISHQILVGKFCLDRLVASVVWHAHVKIGQILLACLLDSCMFCWINILPNDRDALFVLLIS